MEQKSVDLLQHYDTPQTSAQSSAATFVAYLMLAILGVVSVIAASFFG